MSEDNEYYIELKLGLEFNEAEIPCEETLITPIKKFIKDHLKPYKNTTKIVIMDTKIREVNYDDPPEDDN